jgi:hypothetical protein
LTGHEHSREALQDSHDGHEPHQAAAAAHGIAAFGHDDIAALAYELWQAKGRPEGSAQEDWFQAAEQLRARSYGRS